MTTTPPTGCEGSGRIRIGTNLDRGTTGRIEDGALLFGARIAG